MDHYIHRIPADYDGFIAHLHAEPTRIIIFGADIAGKFVSEVLKLAGYTPACFVDNNRNKCGIDIASVPVLHASALASEPRSTVVLIASTYIADIVRQLEEMGHYNWVPISEILENRIQHGVQDLLRGDLRKNHAGGEFTDDFDGFVIGNMINSQRKYLDPERLYIRSIDLILTEKCSLKCKDCSNLMQYYDAPVNVAGDELLNDLADICAVADEINEIRIIGGEPLMNKNFHNVVAAAAAYPNVNKVVVYTNGTICPPDEKLAMMANPKIFIFITTYGALSRNADSLEQGLKRHNILYNRQPAYGWTDCASVQPHARQPEELPEIFRFCCAKHFTTLTDGKIFRCPFSANMERLHALPESSDDYVNIRGLAQRPEQIAQMKSALRLFLREKSFINACNFCNGRTYGDPEIVPGIQTKEVLVYKKYERLTETKNTVEA